MAENFPLFPPGNAFFVVGGILIIGGQLFDREIDYHIRINLQNVETGALHTFEICVDAETGDILIRNFLDGHWQGPVHGGIF